MEEGIGSLDFRPGGAHSILQVLDLHGSPGFVKRRHITKRAFAILQDNYPELVAKQVSPDLILGFFFFLFVCLFVVCLLNFDGNFEIFD